MSWNYYKERIEIYIGKKNHKLLIKALLSTSKYSSDSIELFGMPGYVFPKKDDYCAGRIVVKTGSMVANPLGIEFNYSLVEDYLIIDGVDIYGNLDYQYVKSSLNSLVNSILSGSITIDEVNQEAYFTEARRYFDSFLYGYFTERGYMLSIDKKLIEKTFFDISAYIDKYHNKYITYKIICNDNDYNNIHRCMYSIAHKMSMEKPVEILYVIEFNCKNLDMLYNIISNVKSSISSGFKGDPLIRDPANNKLSIGLSNIRVVIIHDINNIDTDILVKQNIKYI